MLSPAVLNLNLPEDIVKSFKMFNVFPEVSDHLNSKVTEVKFNIEDVAVPGPLPDKKVALTDSLGIVLKFPTFQDIAYTQDDINTNIMFDLITTCVDYVYDNDDIYKDFTKEEMGEWIGNLGQTQFEKITQFFENMPRLTHELKWKCEACGREDSMVVEGVQSFFT